jgi:hypothetical protein
MSLRRRLTALERRVEQPRYRLVVTITDEEGRKWKFTDDGSLVPVEPGELDGARVIRLDLEDDES